jgi:putative acetyltransferase
MIIRPENPTDIPAIRSLVTAAFRDAPHSDGNEANIVDALRIGGVLTVSLVAEDEGKIVGHVAFSPIAVNSQEFNWFGPPLPCSRKSVAAESERPSLKPD